MPPKKAPRWLTKSIRGTGKGKGARTGARTALQNATEISAIQDLGDDEFVTLYRNLTAFDIENLNTTQSIKKLCSIEQACNPYMDASAHIRNFKQTSQTTLTSQHHSPSHQH